MDELRAPNFSQLDRELDASPPARYLLREKMPSSDELREPKLADSAEIFRNDMLTSARNLFKGPDCPPGFMVENPHEAYKFYEDDLPAESVHIVRSPEWLARYAGGSPFEHYVLRVVRPASRQMSSSLREVTNVIIGDDGIKMINEVRKQSDVATACDPEWQADAVDFPESSFPQLLLALGQIQRCVDLYWAEQRAAGHTSQGPD